MIVGNIIEILLKQNYSDKFDIKEFDKQLTILALNENDGNREKAAKELFIAERTIYRKIRKYSITIQDKKEIKKIHKTKTDRIQKHII